MPLKAHGNNEALEAM